ncbi:MAG: RNA methyltransferase [Bacteroidetes bacterium]|nr:MAG: RNA methyltransferase [Bacteroidota bacterium]
MRKRLNEELGRLSVEDFRHAEKLPLVIVLDNVRSQNNIGSVFRTADAFRVEALYLCGITAIPPHREIHKTALGATESVSWSYREETLSLLTELKARGYVLYAVEQAEGSLKLEELKPKTGEKMALVFGHEIRGVDQEVVDACDYALEIPQFGTKHSLNIAVAAGIVVWEAFRSLSPAF